MQLKHCYECGTPLEAVSPGNAWHCSACKRDLYANPVPTVDAMLFDDDGKILLGRRARNPSKGKLNLPGGFVDIGETLEEAIARELQEELGLQPKDYSKLSYAGSRFESYVYQGLERKLICIIMVGSIKHRDFPINDEVSEFVWQEPASINQDGINKKEYDHILQAAKLYSQ